MPVANKETKKLMITRNTKEMKPKNKKVFKIKRKRSDFLENDKSEEDQTNYNLSPKDTIKSNSKSNLKSNSKSKQLSKKKQIINDRDDDSDDNDDNTNITEDNSDTNVHIDENNNFETKIETNLDIEVDDDIQLTPQKTDLDDEYDDIDCEEELQLPKSRIKKTGDNDIGDVLAEIGDKADLFLEREIVEEKALPKRRGRKPKNNIFDIPPTNPKKEKKSNKLKPKTKKQSEEPIEDYIILQLPIFSKDLDEVDFVDDKLMRYNDKIEPEPEPEPSVPKNSFEVIHKPSPIDLIMGDRNGQTVPSNVSNIPNMNILSNANVHNNVVKIVKEKQQPVEYTKQELQRRLENIKERKPGHQYENKQIKQIKLMTQYNESSRRGIWLSNTNLYCFWCFHPFEGIPWAIPVKVIEGRYHVDGNFCSPECAAAYNFDQKDHNMWERYSLLNMLYNKVNHPSYQKLKLAPPRRMLIHFGGNMTIEEFRNHCSNYTKDYIISFPPMISIPTIAEETNLSDKYQQKAVYIDKERVDEASRRCRAQDQEMMEQDNSLQKCFSRIAAMNA